MPRPRVHDDALRARLLDATTTVVADKGADAVTVRDVAARAGTSASAVYTLFGSREALVREAGEHAFARFGERLAAVPRTTDPGADLLALGEAYRAFALDAPHAYRVMFTSPGAGAQDPVQGGTVGAATFAVLRDAVRAALAARRGGGPADGAAAPADASAPDGTTAGPPDSGPTDGVPTGDGPGAGLDDVVERAALGLWGLVHGMVLLELDGHVPGEPAQRSALYRHVLGAAGPAVLTAR